jgi:N,N'-diacetyllegionaminate synthase
MSELLNNSNHTFVIAEAGSNWKCGSYKEDLEQAKKLIKAAANARANAVKFQTFRPETVFVPDAGKIEYLAKKGIDKTINEVFEEMAMPYSMIPELSKYCKEQNIIFMSTAFSIKDAEKIDPYVDVHKIASFEINHVRLIEYLIKTKKPLIISTGASGYEEIDFIIDLIKKNGENNITLLQCTSKYPAPSNTLNLAVIPELKNRYNIPVGFSDHSLDPIIAPVIAVGLGATIIEKHFTLDRNLPGPDHASSLIPNELEIMVKGIREAEKMIGSKEKKIIEEELELRHAGTRAIQAIKEIAEGEILKEGENFEVLRPGKRSRGSEPRFLDIVNGKRASKSVKTGDGILDFE